MFAGFNSVFDVYEYTENAHLWPYYIILGMIVSVLVSGVHWIFATQYLEVALLLPLLIDPGQADIPKKQHQVQCIIIAINVYFFAQLATYAGLLLASSSYDDRVSYYKIANFDAANKLLPVLLLISSLLFLRCRFTGERSRKAFASEKIIVVHSAIFLSFVIIYTNDLVFHSYWFSSPKESIQYCHFYLSSWYFSLLGRAVNIASLVLFIKMSVMFSRPLSGYWREFLLSYRR